MFYFLFGVLLFVGIVAFLVSGNDTPQSQEPKSTSYAPAYQPFPVESNTKPKKTADEIQEDLRRDFPDFLQQYNHYTFNEYTQRKAWPKRIEVHKDRLDLGEDGCMYFSSYGYRELTPEEVIYFAHTLLGDNIILENYEDAGYDPGEDVRTYKRTWGN